MAKSSKNASQVIPVRIPADVLALIDAAIESRVLRGKGISGGRSEWIKDAIAEVLGKAKRGRDSRARKAALSRRQLQMRSQFERDFNRVD